MGAPDTELSSRPVTVTPVCAAESTAPINTTIAAQSNQTEEDLVVIDAKSTVPVAALAGIKQWMVGYGR
jgi:hypothetical protein